MQVLARDREKGQVTPVLADVKPSPPPADEHVASFHQFLEVLVRIAMEVRPQAHHAGSHAGRRQQTGGAVQGERAPCGYTRDPCSCVSYLVVLHIVWQSFGGIEELSDADRLSALFTWFRDEERNHRVVVSNEGVMGRYE